MGRNAASNGIPKYREVLIANAVRSLRDSFPRFPATAGRRAWLAASAVEGGWRAVAIAAGAIPDHALSR